MFSERSPIAHYMLSVRRFPLQVALAIVAALGTGDRRGCGQSTAPVQGFVKIRRRDFQGIAIRRDSVAFPSTRRSPGRFSTQPVNKKQTKETDDEDDPLSFTPESTRMKRLLWIPAATLVTVLAGQSAHADTPSSFGSGFDEQVFYKPFSVEDITPENMQKWPYYKYASVHWDEFALHGTEKISRSSSPSNLAVAEGDERLDMNLEWKDGDTFLESFTSTQVKAFVVMKDNRILAEFFDNGFLLSDTQLLQSASKTIAGVIGGRLVDEGLLDPKDNVEEVLADFKGTDLGAATVQQVLDMTSGLPGLLDYHTPGAPGQAWEVEIGLQPGKTKGHRKNLKASKAEAKPGEAYNYSDKNTDVLGLLYEQVSGKKYTELVADLFDAFGANQDGSIALTSDGTASANYGISMSARDYALFHQWLAQGKAPKSYYESAMDTRKTKFGENEFGKLFGTGITYGSQTYYMKEHDVLYSQGSFGQQGFSDMKTGVAVVFMQDWAVNAEMDKLLASREKALAIIHRLRAQTHPDSSQ